MKLHLALIDQALNGGCCRWLRGTGQRNMTLTSQQTRSRVQSYPTRTRQVHLAPSVQIGKVNLGTARTIKGFDVWCQLDEVARYKASSQSQVTQQLHQQPSRVATRTTGFDQSFFGRLNTGFHANEVADVLLHALIQAHQKVDGALGLAIDVGQVGLKPRRRSQRGINRQVRCQFVLNFVGVGQRDFFGRRL